MSDKKIYAIIVGVIVVALLIYFSPQLGSEYLTMTDCKTCPKCGSGLIRPNARSRYGCNSTKCRCINHVPMIDTSYIRLNCNTCPKCEDNYNRPNKTISTTVARGCNDRRCRCEPI